MSPIDHERRHHALAVDRDDGRAGTGAMR
jgi:hypothetical protein